MKALTKQALLLPLPIIADLMCEIIIQHKRFVHMITFHDIQTARERIRNLVIKTPLLTSDRLNDKLGFSVVCKAEPLQRIGAFKFRGACNALLQLPEEANQVIAFSSGNHAGCGPCGAADRTPCHYHRLKMRQRRKSSN